MSEGTAEPPIVRVLVRILWASPPLRALLMRWWPQGRIRHALITGFFVRMYEHINRDRVLPDGVLHRDFVLRFPPDVEVLRAKAQAMRGPGAIRSMFDALEEGLSEIRWVPEKVIEAPRGQILAFVRMEAAGGRSQVPLSQPVAIVASLENGRISEGTMFVDRDRALEAVGLSESIGDVGGERGAAGEASASDI